MEGLGTSFIWLYISQLTRWLICNGGDHHGNLPRISHCSLSSRISVLYVIDCSFILIPFQHNGLTWAYCLKWKRPTNPKELMRRDIGEGKKNHHSSCDLSFCYTLTKSHEKNQWHHSIKLLSDSWWFHFAHSYQAFGGQNGHLRKTTECLWKLQRLTR